MKKQGAMFQTKEQDKSPETDLNEMEVSNLPKWVNITIIKMLTVLKRTIHKQNENFNRDMKKQYAEILKSIRNHRAEEYYDWPEILIEGFNSRLDQVEQRSLHLKTE